MVAKLSPFGTLVETRSCSCSCSCSPHMHRSLGSSNALADSSLFWTGRSPRPMPTLPGRLSRSEEIRDAEQGSEMRRKGKRFSLTVVAGRKNDPGSSVAQRKKPWQPNDRNSDGYGRQRPTFQTESLDVGKDSEKNAGKFELREDQAIGQVVAAQANFLRVVVTCCEGTVDVGSNSSSFKITDLEDGLEGNIKRKSNEFHDRKPEDVVHPEGHSSSLSSAFSHPTSSSSSSSSPSATHSSSPSSSAQRVGTELLCYVRAVLKKMRRRVLVGDVVVVGGIDWTDQRGMVERILPRQSELSEPPISNVDRLVLLFSFRKPDLEPLNLSRFLVAAEASGLPFTLAINKSDLVSEEAIDEWKKRLHDWGYSAHICSIETKHGIESLRKIMSSQVSVIAGPSGVGKSSLIKALRNSMIGSMEDKPILIESQMNSTPCDGGGGALFPSNAQSKNISSPSEGTNESEFDEELETDDDLNEGVVDEEELRDMRMSINKMQTTLFADISVGEVSERSGRGRHTTRHVSLLKLPHGGYLADTPGFNQPSLNTLSVGNLPQCFPEIRNRLEAQKDETCAFKNCLHVSEPNCIVDSNWERFSQYKQLLEELKIKEEAEKKNPSSQIGSIKVKTKAMGIKQAEPMLETKRHRRESRRRVRQSLLDIIENEEGDE